MEKPSLIAQGHRNAEASEWFGMTVNTVGSYTKLVYRSVRSR